MDILRVSAKSNPNAVAGAIANMMRGKTPGTHAGDRCRQPESGNQSHRYCARVCSSLWKIIVLRSVFSGCRDR